MSIGSWTLPGTYPGEEDLRWNHGEYADFDPCTGALREEAFFGVTTLEGYPARTIPSTGVPGVALPPTFIDQHNALRSGATVMNVPWKRSDHFINLNLP